MNTQQLDRRKAAVSEVENVPIRIRLATDDDAAGILSVYASYIDTPITFEESVPSAENSRTHSTPSRLPYLVAETVPARPTQSDEAPSLATRTPTCASRTPHTAGTPNFSTIPVARNARARPQNRAVSRAPSRRTWCANRA